MPSDTPLQVIQYGAEGDATRGTVVPATRVLAGGKVAWTAIDEVYRPDHPVGLYVFNPTSPVVLFRGTELAFDGDLSLEEMVDFLEMSVKEDAAPDGVGPYTWVFDPSESADNDPRSYTFERRVTDGITPSDIEAAHVMAQGFTVSQGVNEPTKLRVDMVGRRVQASTLTPALSVPALSFLTAGNWTVYIDDEGTAFGTTQILGQARTWEFHYLSGLFEKYFLDGRADLDFSSLGTGRRGVESLRMQIEWGTLANAERTAAAAQTLRLVRLVGTLGANSITFDMVMRHAKGDFLTVQDENGNDVTDLELVAAHDTSPEATDPAHFECQIVNDRATL